MQKVYLDYAATTPLDPRVFEAMKPLLMETFGNPSSSHFFGREARAAIDSARDTIAVIMGALPSEIYFTSGGTEADNLAIIGAAFANRPKGNHIITQKTEHSAVLDPCRWLEGEGFHVTYLPTDEYGLVDPQDLAGTLRDDTILVSIMHANNEVGTVYPIKELADITHEQNALFHTDAVQTFGLLPVDVNDLGVDLLSVSSHKIYGPKGTGALYVKKGVAVNPLFHGGGQEREKRPGTENQAGIAGFAEAARLADSSREEKADKLSKMRDSFISEVTSRIHDVYINGHPEQCLPGIANLSFIGLDTENLLLSLDLEGIAASGGAACTAGAIGASHVLRSMGLPPERTCSTVRFSLGKLTTDEEIAYTVDVLERVVERMR